MQNEKKAKKLKIWWRIFFCSPLIVAALWSIMSIHSIISEQQENSLINQIIWIGALISLILFIIWCFFIWIAGKYEISNRKPSFLKEEEKLTEDQEKSIRKFSRWGFWAPAIMLFFTKDYIWAILILLFDAGWLLPRTILWRYGRRWLAENRNRENFEEYEKKTKKRWILCSIIWILFLLGTWIYCYWRIKMLLIKMPELLYII